MSRIVVQGLDELVRDLRRADSELKSELADGLKDIAKDVAEEAKSIAGGFRKSGDLIRGIKPSVRGSTAYVRSTAKHRGFGYPGRLEFGDLNRPHLGPALARKEGEIVQEVEKVVDKTLSALDL